MPVNNMNSIGMRYRLIPPGEFLMGSTAEEIEPELKGAGNDTAWRECINLEVPKHRALLTQLLYVGNTDVA